MEDEACSDVIYLFIYLILVCVCVCLTEVGGVWEVDLHCDLCGAMMDRLLV